MISQGASKVSPTQLFWLNCCLHAWSQSTTLCWIEQKFGYLCMSVSLITISTGQVNISLVVNDNEAEQCVRALHSEFFESDLL